MTKKNTKKIQAVVNKIVQEYHPEKIILFGSYVWGKPGPDSDVDLFIITKTENTRALAREIDGLLFPRLFPIDVLVYTPEHVEKRKKRGDFFINDILTKGKVLYAA
ncbi:nucleotidyltransferase domain-containing protein [Patescibacteria group bacterium AH-259-L07]|nr:nucleotidyltransferase domain-containing protein [Patescibacteria group bacterium AH-259-L07]